MSTVELLERVAAPAPVPERRRRRLPDLRRRISPIALIVLWQVSSATGLLPPDKLSSPWTVLRASVETALSGELGEAFAVSAGRVGLGFLIGASIAVMLGIVAGLSTVIQSEQDLADAFTEDGVLPGKVDFGQFVDRRFVNDIDKG